MVLGLRGIPYVQGGIETHCEKLYPLIVHRGYQVILIARISSVGDAPYVFQGVQVIPTWAPKMAGFEALYHTFFGVLRARMMGANVLHLHAIGPAIFAPLARILGLKVVVTHHGPDYDRQKWGTAGKLVLRYGEAMGVRYAHKLIVISKTIRTLVEKKYRRKDSVIIFNGVVPPPEDPQDEITSTLRKYGLEDRKYVLAVGRLVPEKGFHDLLEALGGRDDLTVVIAGASNPSTGYSETLVKRASEYGAVMTGFIKGAPLRHLFWGASLFVLPSSHEGLPIALLEAMSFGKNILVSDIPANLDVRLPKDCYFKVGNVDDLRRCALKKLESPSQNGFARTIKRQYNWSIIAKKTSNIYRQLTER